VIVADHHASVDAFRFGRSVKALRHRRGWRQVDLAERSGLSRSVVGRIELGQVDRIAFGDLQAAARALDGQLELNFRWRGESLDRLIDERHAAIVDEVVRIYRAAGWEVAVEASFSIYGERGSIDVLGWHRYAELLAVNEIKASVPEAGNTVMGVDRKARLAPVIARDRGWRCRGVARFLVVADGSTSRDRIARHADVFRTAFPAGTRGVARLDSRSVHTSAERDHLRLAPECPCYGFGARPRAAHAPVSVSATHARGMRRVRGGRDSRMAGNPAHEPSPHPWCGQSGDRRVGASRRAIRRQAGGSEPAGNPAIGGWERAGGQSGDRRVGASRRAIRQSGAPRGAELDPRSGAPNLAR
jgi:transcriptional regulator with XRE-family HTH domain